MRANLERVMTPEAYARTLPLCESLADGLTRRGLDLLFR